MDEVSKPVGRAIFRPRWHISPAPLVMAIVRDIVRAQTENGGESPIAYEVSPETWRSLEAELNTDGRVLTDSFRVMGVPVVCAG